MFTPLALGEKLKSVAIERYKAVEGMVDVISVVSRAIASTNAHYAPGIGFFYCWRGACCEQLGLPQQRYILPIVQYTVESLKNRKYGVPVMMYYLPLSQAQYNTKILTIEDIQQDITTVDLAVTCSDAGYQKNDFQVVGAAMWRKDKVIAENLKELWKDYKSLIEMSCARTLDEQLFLKLLSANGAENVPDHNQRNPPPPKNNLTGRKQLSLGAKKAAPAAEEMGNDMGLDDPTPLWESKTPGEPPTVDVEPATTPAPEKPNPKNEVKPAEPAGDQDFSSLLES